MEQSNSIEFNLLMVEIAEKEQLSSSQIQSEFVRVDYRGIQLIERSDFILIIEKHIGRKVKRVEDDTISSKYERRGRKAEVMLDYAAFITELEEFIEIIKEKKLLLDFILSECNKTSISDFLNRLDKNHDKKFTIATIQSLMRSARLKDSILASEVMTISLTDRTSPKFVTISTLSKVLEEHKISKSLRANAEAEHVPKSHDCKDFFIQISQYLKRMNFSSLQNLARDAYNLDYYGNLDQNEFPKLIRTMCPGISIGDINTIEKEIASDSTMTKFSIPKLDVLVEKSMVLEAAKGSSAKRSDKTILDESNSALKHILEDLALFCRRNELVFLDLFKSCDDREFTPFVTFEKICNAEKLDFNEDDFEYIKERYMNQEDYTINYAKMDSDISLIDPAYIKLKERFKAHVSSIRTPEIIINLVLAQVLKKMKSLQELCETVDSRGTRKVSKVDVFNYFKSLDPLLTKEEFIIVYKTLIPTRKKDMQYFEFIQHVKRAMSQIITEILGQILNAFDEKREGLGVYLNKNALIKKGKIKSTNLKDALQLYKNFEENEFEHFLHCLDIQKNFQNLYTWREVKEKLYSAMKRANLREEFILSSFFTFKELVKGDASGAIMNLLTILRSKMRVVGLRKARELFDMFDKNKSESITFAEYEELIMSEFPSTGDSSIRESFSFMTGDSSAREITRKQFEDCLLNKIPLEEKEEILYEETKWAEKTFSEIVYKLEEKKLSINSVLAADEMIIDQVLDTIREKLEIWQLSAIRTLLNSFVLGHDLKLVSTKEFKIVLEKYSEDIKDKQNSKNGHLSKTKNEYTQEEIDYALHSIEEVKRGIKKRKYSVKKIFEKLDKDHNHTLDFNEVFFFLQIFKKDVSKREADIIFGMVDVDKSKTVSIAELTKFFSASNLAETSILIESSTSKGQDSVANIIEDIADKVNKSKKSLRYIFSLSSSSMLKRVFQEKLKKIEFRESAHPKFAEFMKLITLESKDAYVDLDKFDYIMSRSARLNKHIFHNEETSSLDLAHNSLDVFLSNVLDHFENNIIGIINYFDLDANGTISKGEFIVNSRKLFNGLKKEELTSIFAKLDKQGKGTISCPFLKKELLRVLNLFNKDENDRTINESAVIGSPRINKRSFIHTASMELADDSTMFESNKGMRLKEEEILTRIRKQLNYQRDKLLQSFKKIDSQRNMLLAKEYISDAFEDAGVRNIDKAERGIILTDLEQEDGKVFYMDLLDKIFPSYSEATGENISDINQFIDVLRKDMKLRQISSKQIFFELLTCREPSSSELARDHLGEINRVNLKRGATRKGLLIEDKNLWGIFKELDYDRDGKISYHDFRKLIVSGSSENETNLLNRIKLELTHTGITIDNLFKAAGKSNGTDLSLEDFIKSTRGLSLEIDVLDCETLFGLLDKDGNDRLSRSELEDIFQRISSKSLDLNNLRMAIFKYLKKRNKSFSDFLHEIDYSRHLRLNYREFSELLQMLGFSDIEERKRDELFKVIDNDGDYFISFKEFTEAYNEQSVDLLFKYIGEFRKKLIKLIELEKTPLTIIIRKYDRDCDGFISKEEFLQMVADLKVDGIQSPDDTQFLLESVDKKKDGKIDEAEISTFLMPTGVFDVIETIERVRRVLRSSRSNLIDIFSQTDKDKSGMISLAEFSLLMRNCGITLNAIEANEFFRYIDSKKIGQFTDIQFYEVFDYTQNKDPRVINQNYFDELDEENHTYYIRKYGRIGNSRVKYYNEIDDHALEKRFNSVVPKPRTSLFERTIRTRFKEEEDAPASVSSFRRPQPPRPYATFDDKVSSWRTKISRSNQKEIERFASLIHSELERSKQTPEKLLDFFDRDYNDKIELSEFEAFCRASGYRESENTTREIFSFIDSDAKNYITKEDFRDFLNHYCSKSTFNSLAQPVVSGDSRVLRTLIKDWVDDQSRIKRVNSRELFLQQSGNKREMNLLEFEDMVSEMKLPNNPTRHDIEQLFGEITGRDKYLKIIDFESLFGNQSINHPHRETTDSFDDSMIQLVKMGGERDIHRNEIKTPSKQSPEFIKELLIQFYDGLVPTRLNSSAKRLSLALDMNGSGSVSQRDLEDFCHQYRILQKRSDVRDLFAHYKDRSGFLDTDSFIKDLFFMRSDTIEAYESGRNSHVHLSSSHVKKLASREAVSHFDERVDPQQELHLAMENIRNEFLDRVYDNRFDLILEFESCDYQGLGYWTYEDFDGFIASSRLLKNLPNVTKKNLFKSFDPTNSRMVSRSTFFKFTMHREYRLLMDDLAARATDPIRLLKEAMKMKRIRNVYDLFGVTQTRIDDRQLEELALRSQIDILRPDIVDLLKICGVKADARIIDIELLNDILLTARLDLNQSHREEIIDNNKKRLELPIRHEHRSMSTFKNGRMMDREDDHHRIRSSRVDYRLSNEREGESHRGGTMNRYDSHSTLARFNPPINEPLENTRVQLFPSQFNDLRYDRRFGEPDRENSYGLSNKFDTPTFNRQQSQSMNNITLDQATKMYKVLENIAGFMKEDNLDFKSLFGKFDKRQTHIISENNLADAIYVDLNLSENQAIEDAIQYYTKNNVVDLEILKEDLQKVESKKYKPHEIFNVVGSNLRVGHFGNEKFNAPNFHSEDLRLRELAESISRYFKQKLRLKNHNLFDYFDQRKDNKIDDRTFVNGVLQSGFNGCNEKELIALFDLADKNKTGYLSINEFRHIFFTEDAREAENFEGAESSKTVDSELNQIFAKIDANKNGFIDLDEFATCLRLLRYPSNPAILYTEFAKCDENKDGKIDIHEFKYLMRRRLKNDFLKLHSHIQEARNILRLSHPTGGVDFDYNQFRKAVAQLNYRLHEEEIRLIFEEIDYDEQDLVNIEDFLLFLVSEPDDYEDKIISEALLKIKKINNMDILELIDAYNKCPSNYTHSFTVEQIKELKNLPSEDFYPRLNASGSAFEDIPQKYSPNGDPNLTIQPIQSKFTAHFTMVEARGLAVPHDKDMRESTSFVTREARFCILNDNTNTFIGSMVVILADNSSKIPGNWTFNGTGRYDNAVVCRLAEYEVNSRAEYHKLSLVVEFVGYFSKNGIELQMSCGWAKIPLVSLTLPGPTTLQIMSGSPFDDQKLGNSTAVARFGMRSQAEEDRQIREATLNVTDTNKLSPEFADSLELLPKSCILPHSLVGITKAYRFYLAANAYTREGVNYNIIESIHLKTFLRCLNLKSLQLKLSEFWAKRVEPCIRNDRRCEIQIAMFETITKSIDNLLEDPQFSFNPFNQTAEYYTSNGFVERIRMIDQEFREIEHQLDGKFGVQDSRAQGFGFR